MIKLKNILKEIKLVKGTSTPIKIGKKYVNPSTSVPGEKPNEVKTYNWEEGSKLLSTITKKNAERLFIEILGITPKWVKIENSPKAVHKSFYIYGEYNGEPILIARRETRSIVAGQTKVYSKYKVLQLSSILGKYNQQMYNDMGDIVRNDWREKTKWIKKNKQKYYENNTKETILNALKINV